MEIAFILFFVLNVIFTWSIISTNKKDKEWLNNAYQAYNDNEKTSFYPKSEVLLKKNNYKYNCNFHFLIITWLILFIIPLFCEVKTFIIIYIINFMYSRILNFLGLIENKIDIIKKQIFKED